MDWLIYFALFAAGTGSGVLLYHFGWNKTSEIKKLMRDNHQLNREHRELQTSIDDYFGTTNQLIKDLNDSYGALQKHFNSGIETLGKRASLQHEHLLNQPTFAPDASEQAAVAIEHNAEEIAKSHQDTLYTAPKDYAPKEQSEAGMLSENFGFKGNAS